MQLFSRQIRTFPAGALVCALVAVGVAPASAVQRAGADDPTEAATLPRDLEGIGIEDRPGAEIPKDVVLRDHLGREVTSASLFDGQRPTILVFAYYSCPMLCTLVLNGITSGIRSLAWNLGKEYRVVAVSIDARDTAEVARNKRATHVKDYGRQVTDDEWPFYTGDAAGVKRLADAVGFTYRWDEASQQFSHAAGAFVVTPTGTLSRTLYGITFPERDLRLALVEAGEGRVGSTMDRLLLFCFHYDPQQRGYVLAATRVMKAGGALTLTLMLLFLRAMWRHERATTLKVKEA